MTDLMLRSATVLLVGMPGLSPVLAQDSSSTWPIGQQTEHVLKASDGGEVPYLLYQPAQRPDEKRAEPDQKLPLMLFLHGRGESDGPPSLVAKWGPPRRIAMGESMPFLVVSPQCPREDRWNSETQQTRLIELLEKIHRDYPIDKDRVYLTGLSMGGFGSWRLAADHPDRFAAVVPVCGGGDPAADAESLVDLPIWVFHGDQDKAVDFQRSVEMVGAIRAAGGTKVRFTSLENFGHNSWSATYATPEVYQWMLHQRISDRVK